MRMPVAQDWWTFMPMLGVTSMGGYYLGDTLLQQPYYGLAVGAGASLTGLVHTLRTDVASTRVMAEHVLCSFAAMPLCGLGGQGVGWLTAALMHWPRSASQVAGLAIGTVCGWLIMTQREAELNDQGHHGNIYGIARFLTLHEALEPEDSAPMLSDTPGKGLYLGQLVTWLRQPRMWGVFDRAPRPVIHDLVYPGSIGGLVVSPAGGGKFSCSIAKTLFTNTEDHVVVLDPTGQATAVTGGSVASGAKAWRRNGLGRRVVVINPFHILGHLLQASASLNPLADIDPDSPTFEADLRGIAGIIQPVHDAESNRFFSEASRELITALLIHARLVHGTAATLPMVNEMLQESEPYLNEHVFLPMRYSEYAAVRAIGNLYWLPEGHARGKTAEGVLQTAKTSMGWLSDGVMQRLFGKADFSWRELKRTTPERLTIYLVWPSDKGEDYAKASELILSTAINTLLNYPKTPVLMLVDEMANALIPRGRGIAMIRRGFAEGRKYGLRIIGYLQNWSQLIALAGEEDASTIAANAGVKTFFGAAPGDNITADYVCDTIGQQTIWKPGQNEPIFSEDGRTLVGWKQVPHEAAPAPLIHPQHLPEFARQGLQLTLLGQSGFPLLSSRFPHYYAVRAMMEKADPDPFHEGQESHDAS